MKHSLLSMSAGLALVLALAGTIVLSGALPNAAAANDPFACDGSSLYFPVTGVVGWRYGDPASTDRDASGNPTVHTGIDIFADAGSGATVYAPAAGMVSRQHSPSSLNLILSGVTNVVNGETGVELYVTHITPSLSIGDRFEAGDPIGVQSGDHVHFSVGNFMGFDDREIEQTQDPSPYFGAFLTYDADATERHEVSHWCDPSVAANLEVVALQTATATPPPAAGSAPATQEEAADQEYVVQSGDTLGAIAAQFDVTVEAIAEANGLVDLDMLEVGQQLIIPGAGGSAPAAESTTTTTQTDEPAAPQAYVVQEGDTLYSIAEQFGVTVDDIVSANGLTDADYLSIGQELQIPGSGAPQGTLTETAESTGPSGGEYVVVEGDTLSTIAEAHGTDVETLQSLNGIEDPSFINVGDTLILP